ncbi:hypothetical protein CONCODRAFT_9785 [Conidiobolus coronatus NRRL 28638]|uniref:Uncharacterized protein n=1 Tax=Conidiobolus coronatus (strain ATCC 28846 / CBS 209.66 / NRRL 28638) TaxID=796925 RepID=A0A137NZD3_CONC2|nr:hypothetical protein CONCODRAFT_9785 [Conidiobolus coronatus NRRL 28638]|eukprot:KXN68058.1 hypothetical protein CONCODRAFT_9785 [Conidiobolus coronatus NRRL 28638]
MNVADRVNNMNPLQSSTFKVVPYVKIAGYNLNDLTDTLANQVHACCKKISCRSVLNQLILFVVNLFDKVKNLERNAAYNITSEANQAREEISSVPPNSANIELQNSCDCGKEDGDNILYCFGLKSKHSAYCCHILRCRNARNRGLYCEEHAYWNNPTL